MKILKFEVLVVLMSLMTSLTFGQQLPDPGFENWDGAQFANNAQPKFWKFSNVSQMGVDKNFAHKTTGRSGAALKIQDQFVGVMGIGATSPGYVSLGTPWAYVSSLTTIEDATAGTYGGIEWTNRPDSMVVWIKRYYDSSVDQAAGDHTKDENFNLIFYSWSGTSYAPSFKAKNLSCTDVSGSHPEYCSDEESDIRQALNGNECGTKVQAKQIAEGWYYEKKAYANWTRICVPIYYFNDDIPEKCNVILSAGNYPNFRANSGQNAGNSMDVDDIELIYSSKIQKLYINKKEWKGFNPNNTDVQTYSLGLGATQMPDIVAYRGAGSLTNNRGGKATFPGRRLGENECVIKKGTVDGEPTTITVTAEDGSSTTTYTIKFVSQSSDNARLSDIRVNGQSVSGFNAYLTNYNVSLPYGTTQAPTVEATAQDGSATVDIQQAGSPSGQAVILVTAGDGTTQVKYTVSFSVAALTDVTLQGIYADGSLLPGFTPSKSSYVLSLPLGTTSAPAITWKSAYEDGVQSIQMVSNTLDGGAEIRVSIPGGTASKTYKIKYKIEASTYSYLAGIALDGVALDGFAPDKFAYTITLPMGTTSLPDITWTTGDAWQTVKLTTGDVDGLTTIEVKAASGAVSTYRLTFKTEKSGNNALQGIALDGVALEGFHADTLVYRITLPAGTTKLPAITWTAGDAYQKVTLVSNDKQMIARLTVTAGDGSTRVYKLNFEVEKYENAFLQMIYLNGAELAGFVPEQLDYSLVWQDPTMPKVTVLTNPGQAISIASPSGYGTVRIVVTPEGGTPNTYSVTLVSPDEVSLPPFPTDSFPVSNDASLAGLYIGGKAYPAFDAQKYDYTYALPWRTYQVPAVVPVAATKGQTITVAHGAVNRPTTITVMAEDGKVTQQYTVLFTAPTSGNTQLASVEIEGVDNFTFDPSKTTYKDIILPYGTTQAPTLLVERAESEQSLTITEAPLGKASTIEVTAEDGTKATYSFSYLVAYPNEPNVLQSIIIDGIGALDAKQTSDFTLDLPYGTTGIDIVSVTKTYPEQEVVIINGGIHEPTQIRVKSLNPAEEDKIYTITPKVYPYDPAQLLDIKIDGVSLPQFRPDVYNYVVRMDSVAPEVTYTMQDGAEMDKDSNDKWVKFNVVAGDDEEYKHTYIVTFFYPNDYTFDLDFENWKDYTNENTNSSGKAPTGWYAPINAVTSGDAGTYYPENATQFITSTKTHGSKCAELATTYLLTSAESMPGFLSLAQPTVSVGKWLLWIYEIHSSLAFGDPISFRNTPDNVAIDYNVQANNRVTGWRFIYDANGMKQVNHQGAFSSITKNKWNTLSQPITYPDEYIPMTLNILISSAQSDKLEDYYVSSDGAQTGKRWTSKMYVDNLRFSYNSSLNGMMVNGTAAKQNGNAFTAEIDAEYVGVPQLVFGHAVSDQMPVVSWEEQENVRTATITNYAEDLSSTTYTLTVTRPKSSNKQCTFALEGKDLKIEKGSPYQTVQLATNDTAYVIYVTAEDGSDTTYYAAWATAEAVAAQVTNIEAEDPIKSLSSARLSVLEEEPNLNFVREHALDSVTLTVTDTCYFIHVFGTGNNNGDTTYVIVRPVSDNALLKTMKTNGSAVKGFEQETYDYTVTLPSLDAFSAEPQDPEAEVRYTIVEIDNANAAVFVQVTAPDGKTQKRYSVLVRKHAPTTEAYLTSIMQDDNELEDFKPATYTYLIDLPAGSALPQIEAVACTGATVETNTVRTGSSEIVTFTVTSEDTKTIRTYTVNVNVLPSEVCTLSELFVGDGILAEFSENKYVYEVELPYGTTELPLIDYVPTDVRSQVEVQTKDMTVTVTVTAEDGQQTSQYIIVFTIAKSDNADLKTIMLDGTEIPNFFTDVYDYTVQLPYGAALPVLTAEKADEAATMAVDGYTITVTAEDGVTTHTYTVTFTHAPSENAYLLSIELDSVLQAGFDPEEFAYQDTVIYGQPMPVITWIVGDEQQQVDTAWIGDTQLTITVTAGDGMNIAEYTLTFVHLLSPNCYLADLQAGGATIEGFHRDSLAYSIVYPAGTDSTALLGIKDITAITEDPNATVEVKIEGTVLQIFVTAPDGTIKVYTISQTILLSTEARLKMIWLDSLEVRAFQPDTLCYTITLAQGAMLPVITAATLDTLGQWELGMETEIENGKQVEIYGMAQNGTMVTYVLTFVYANWAPSGTVDGDDYLFFYAGNGYYKAVTIGIGIQVAIYDVNGAIQMLSPLPVADPMDVTVETGQEGEQRLLRADSTAEGVVFRPVPGKVYFYVFFDSKTKRIAKGGKFILQK